MSELAENEVKQIRKISLGVALTVAAVITIAGIATYHYATKEKDDADEDKASKEK